MVTFFVLDDLLFPMIQMCAGFTVGLFYAAFVTHRHASFPLPRLSSSKTLGRGDK
jgi:hypothetical protein